MTTTPPPIPPFNIPDPQCGFTPRPCEPGELLDAALESAYAGGTSPWIPVAWVVVGVLAVGVIGWLGVSVRKAVEAHRATELKARDIYLKERAAELSARRLAATELNAETRARAQAARAAKSTDANLTFEPATGDTDLPAPPVNLDEEH